MVKDNFTNFINPQTNKIECFPEQARSNVLATIAHTHSIRVRTRARGNEVGGCVRFNKHDG